jgi:hypothetical protein
MLSVKLKLTEVDVHLVPISKPSMLLLPVAVTVVVDVGTPKVIFYILFWFQGKIYIPA